MDPDACLMALLYCLAAAHASSEESQEANRDIALAGAHSHITALQEWLDRGGFSPDAFKVIRAMRLAAEGDWCYDHAKAEEGVEYLVTLEAGGMAVASLDGMDWHLHDWTKVKVLAFRPVLIEPAKLPEGGE